MHRLTDSVVGEKGEPMKLSANEICNVLEVLIGNTHAQGETTADDKAFDRMEVLEQVTDWCLDGFYYECGKANKSEWSMARSGKEAIKYLKETKEWIECILHEVERR